MIYVWRDGCFRDKRTGKPMAKPERREICAPFVVSDIPEYHSPVDGRLISSRSERRDDLKRNNCVDARDIPSPTQGKFLNKRFCQKHGLNYA